ncbi:hypothetical protein WJX74_008644 [Apatococcus lobatus]|uniref:Uncharacterized protein n=1 Tax=Apatococcus lobatus TaxID=904363 RepID=A0AAW1QTC7_9CHLO
MENSWLRSLFKLLIANLERGPSGHRGAPKAGPLDRRAGNTLMAAQADHRSPTGRVAGSGAWRPRVPASLPQEAEVMPALRDVAEISQQWTAMHPPTPMTSFWRPSAWADVVQAYEPSTRIWEGALAVVCTIGDFAMTPWIHISYSKLFKWPPAAEEFLSVALYFTMCIIIAVAAIRLQRWRLLKNKEQTDALMANISKLATAIPALQAFVSRTSDSNGRLEASTSERDAADIPLPTEDVVRASDNAAPLLFANACQCSSAHQTKNEQASTEGLHPAEEAAFPSLTHSPGLVRTGILTSDRADAIVPAVKPSSRQVQESFSTMPSAEGQAIARQVKEALTAANLALNNLTLRLEKSVYHLLGVKVVGHEVAAAALSLDPVDVRFRPTTLSQALAIIHILGARFTSRYPPTPMRQFWRPSAWADALQAYNSDERSNLGPPGPWGLPGHPYLHLDVLLYGLTAYELPWLPASLSMPPTLPFWQKVVIHGMWAAASFIAMSIPAYDHAKNALWLNLLVQNPDKSLNMPSMLAHITQLEIAAQLVRASLAQEKQAKTAELPLRKALQICSVSTANIQARLKCAVFKATGKHLPTLPLDGGHVNTAQIERLMLQEVSLTLRPFLFGHWLGLICLSADTALHRRLDRWTAGQATLLMAAQAERRSPTERVAGSGAQRPRLAASLPLEAKVMPALRDVANISQQWTAMHPPTPMTSFWRPSAWADVVEAYEPSIRILRGFSAVISTIAAFAATPRVIQVSHSKLFTWPPAAEEFRSVALFFTGCIIIAVVGIRVQRWRSLKNNNQTDPLMADIWKLATAIPALQDFVSRTTYSNGSFEASTSEGDASEIPLPEDAAVALQVTEALAAANLALNNLTLCLEKAVYHLLGVSVVGHEVAAAALSLAPIDVSFRPTTLSQALATIHIHGARFTSKFPPTPMWQFWQPSAWADALYAYNPDERSSLFPPGPWGFPSHPSVYLNMLVSGLVPYIFPFWTGSLSLPSTCSFWQKAVMYGQRAAASLIGMFVAAIPDAKNALWLNLLVQNPNKSLNMPSMLAHITQLEIAAQLVHASLAQENQAKTAELPLRKALQICSVSTANIQARLKCAVFKATGKHLPTLPLTGGHVDTAQIERLMLQNVSLTRRPFLFGHGLGEPSEQG